VPNFRVRPTRERLRHALDDGGADERTKIICAGAGFVGSSLWVTIGLTGRAVSGDVSGGMFAGRIPHGKHRHSNSFIELHRAGPLSRFDRFSAATPEAPLAATAG
jgi:hypothetical protein